MPKNFKWLEPSKIRFTQDSIAGNFQDGGLLSLVIQDILEETISTHSFPPIRIVELEEGKWYSLDNRRLYVFRVCEYLGKQFQIRAKVFSKSKLREDRFTTENDGLTVRVRQGQTLNHYKRSWLLEKDDRGNRNLPSTSKRTYSSQTVETSRMPSRSSLKQKSQDHQWESRRVSEQSLWSERQQYALPSTIDPYEEPQFPFSRHTGICRPPLRSTSIPYDARNKDEDRTPYMKADHFAETGRQILATKTKLSDSRKSSRTHKSEKSLHPQHSKTLSKTSNVYSDYSSLLTPEPEIRGFKKSPYEHKSTTRVKTYAPYRQVGTSRQGAYGNGEPMERTGGIFTSLLRCLCCCCSGSTE